MVEVRHAAGASPRNIARALGLRPAVVTRIVRRVAARRVAETQTAAGIYQLKATLEDVSPPIWRRFQVPGRISLAGLHLVLQIVMGWENDHLYHFQVGKRVIGESGDGFSPVERLFGGSSKTELCRLAGVSQATAARRSREIRQLLRLTHFDPQLSRREIAERSPLPNLVEVGGLIAPLELLDSMNENALVESLDEEDGRAVELLREALSELSGLPEPAALRHAAIDLRRRLLSRDPVLRPAARANGWSRRLPQDDHQLWIETAGALIAIKNDTGLSVEEESLLMTLDHADLIGAVLGAVRAGIGSAAGPRHLACHIDSCPEVEGEVDEDDRRLIEAAFDLLVPVWQVVGALDAERRLTELGVWGLPRALAWAWGADFDLP